MSRYIPDGLSAEGRRQLLDTLFAYVEAPSAATELALRQSAAGGDDDYLVRLGQALHAAPEHLRSAWRRDLETADTELLAFGAAPFRPHRDLSADRQIARATIAYLDGRDEATRAVLLRLVPGSEGEDLVAYVDALAAADKPRWYGVLHRVRRGIPVPRSLVRSRDGRRLAAGAVAVLVAAAGLTSYLVFSHPSVHLPTEAPSVLTDWRLAGAIDQPAWLATPGGASSLVAAAEVTCPSGTTCYATDATSGSGGALIETSTDGGASWRPESLSNGMHLTSALACPAIEECVGAGYLTAPSGSRLPSALITTDGGASWTIRPLPADVGTVTDLTCAGTQNCVGTGFETKGAGTGSDGPAIAVSTVDGGTTWATDTLPSPFFPSSSGLACTNAQDCVAVGTATLTGGPARPSRAAGAVLYTTDGGTRWSDAVLPSHTGPVLAAACSSGGHCLATAESSLATTAEDDRPTVVLTTDTAGRSWSVPTGTGLAIGYARAISCPTTEQCWVGGWQLGTAPGVLNAEMEVTKDAGTTWTTVPLPQRLTAAEQQITGQTRLHIVRIPSISCPSTVDCVALASQFTANAADQQVVLRNTGTGG